MANCPDLDVLKSSPSLDEISCDIVAILKPVIKLFYIQTFVNVANHPLFLPRECSDLLPHFTPPEPINIHSHPHSHWWIRHCHHLLCPLNPCTVIHHPSPLHATFLSLNHCHRWVSQNLSHFIEHPILFFLYCLPLNAAVMLHILFYSEAYAWSLTELIWSGPS